MPDDLIGYLLNAIEPDEQQAVEQHLQRDESLRRDLELLRRSLQPLAGDVGHHEVPPGLAHRCCQYVFSRIELMPAALLGTGPDVSATKRRKWSRLDLSVAAAVAVAGAVLLLPAVYQSHVHGQLLQCQNNLKTVGEYEARSALLPAAHVTDSKGTKMHSWRAFLLPKLAQAQLGRQYNFAEPWDGPDNKQVIQTAISAFRCPSDTRAGPSDSSYVAVIGPDTIWNAKTITKAAAGTQGRRNTILLVEMKNSGIQWAEPRDLDLDNLPPGITKQNLMQSLSDHPGGFNVAFADGHVEFIPSTISWTDFAALLSVTDDEKADRSKW
jgi:prepilin-type processing-associated H-X9-DG protein